MTAFLYPVLAVLVLTAGVHLSRAYIPFTEWVEHAADTWRERHARTLRQDETERCAAQWAHVVVEVMVSAGCAAAAYCVLFRLGWVS